MGLDGIPLTGAEAEFGLLFHMQNSRVRPRRSDPPELWTTPEDLGYSPDEAGFEKMAEGLRLYMQNPAYMKEHFPNAARRIRHAVNRDPGLNRIIQFNELGAPLGVAGGLGASGLALRDRNREDAKGPRRKDRR
ncbi:hypothetical protein [Roseospira navarrensis]|uniref:Uncharacterized protein n=1 Tax=Roseospira navarrensis TaxID=140058 RepID=A0A7X2D273_9PROT|nr:hypothetical protein [Roseospira navarrensis]MQX35468.1 hypothetical protein [Roseospira navarrensis]